MPSSLVTLPTEVIELIVRLLPLKDIRNLRLTCKALSDKSCASHFKTFFHTQHVVLTADALQELIVNVEAGGIRSCVRRLCLVGVIDKETERAQTSQVDQRQEEITSLLTQAYNGLAKPHRVDGLLSLSLELRINKNLSNNVLRAATHLAQSRAMWQCAVELLDQSLRALAASNLKLKHLNIFNGPNMEECNLPSDKLSMINWSDPGLADSLSTLTSLSVNICTRALFKTLRDPSDDGPVGRSLGIIEAAQWREERNFDGLAKVLAACPRLEDLDLRYRRIATRVPYRDWEVLKRVARLQTLPILNRLSISGFPANSPDLLDILKRTKPRELSLGPITLETGTFHSILDYCSSKEAKISKASFERLVQLSHRDGAGRVHFISQCPKVPVARPRVPNSAYPALFCSEFAEFEHLDQLARIPCHLDRSGFIGMPQYGGCPPSRRQDHLNNFF